MTVATKNSEWDEGIADVRLAISMMTEPVRTAAFAELDGWIEYPPEGLSVAMKKYAVLAS